MSEQHAASAADPRCASRNAWMRVTLKIAKVVGLVAAVLAGAVSCRH